MPTKAASVEDSSNQQTGEMLHLTMEQHAAREDPINFA
jgi:hypothetical protein